MHARSQATPEAASVQWRAVADQIRPRVPKLAALLDAAEEDVLAYMTFPKGPLHDAGKRRAIECDDPLISLPAVAR